MCSRDFCWVQGRRGRLAALEGSLAAVAQWLTVGNRFPPSYRHHTHKYNSIATSSQVSL